jgi:uncharacterized glyoxalase superfamily protein PhnB
MTERSLAQGLHDPGNACARRLDSNARVNLQSWRLQSAGSTGGIHMSITKKKTKARAKTAPAAKRATSARKATRARTRPGGLTLGSVTPSFTVNDVEKSLAWYRDVLGLVAKDRWEHDGTLLGVEMQAGSVVFMLGQDDWKKGRDRVKGEGFRLYCDTAQDVDRLAAQIESRGGTLLQAPRDEPWGARAFTVADPDGFTVTISRRLRRGRK